MWTGTGLQNWNYVGLWLRVLTPPASPQCVLCKSVSTFASVTCVTLCCHRDSCGTYITGFLFWYGSLYIYIYSYKSYPDQLPWSWPWLAYIVPTAYCNSISNSSPGDYLFLERGAKYWRLFSMENMFCLFSWLALDGQMVHSVTSKSYFKSACPFPNCF